jgi:hypothetical protein
VISSAIAAGIIAFYKIISRPQAIPCAILAKVSNIRIDIKCVSFDHIAITRYQHLCIIGWLLAGDTLRKSVIIVFVKEEVIILLICKVD